MKNYYWPNLRDDMEQYVKSCVTCQQNKTQFRKEAGLLRLLPIPTKCWKNVSMDFITHLPKSKGFNSIMVVVDRVSKMAHFLRISLTSSLSKFIIQACTSVLVPRVQSSLQFVIRVSGLPASSKGTSNGFSPPLGDVPPYIYFCSPLQDPPPLDRGGSLRDTPRNSRLLVLGLPGPYFLTRYPIGMFFSFLESPFFY